MKKLMILALITATPSITYSAGPLVPAPPTSPAAPTAPTASSPSSAPTEGSDNVESLAWLSGCWHGEQGEECWLPPLNGAMLGLNRGPDGEHFETLRIAREEDGSVVYFASPMGRCPATPFRLTKSSHQRATFSNPEHDFPQEIVYWIDKDSTGEETLHAAVSATTEGKTRGFEITWKRRSWSPEHPQPPLANP